MMLIIVSSSYDKPPVQTGSIQEYFAAVTEQTYQFY